MALYARKFQKNFKQNLHISKKSSTFAAVKINYYELQQSRRCSVHYHSCIREVTCKSKIAKITCGLCMCFSAGGYPYFIAPFVHFYAAHNGKAGTRRTNAGNGN